MRANNIFVPIYMAATFGLKLRIETLRETWKSLLSEWSSTRVSAKNKVWDLEEQVLYSKVEIRIDAADIVEIF